MAVVGHNHSERSIQSARRREEANRRHLAGWTWAGGKLEPLPTVEGLFARGGQLVARCQTVECRRHLQVDLQDWIRHGFGDLSLATLQAAYRCSRVGCRLSFGSEQYPSGVPIQFYAGTEDRLDVACRGCGKGQRFTAEALIAKLEGAQTGDGNAGVNDLAHRIRGRCPACKYPGWIVTLVRPPRPATPDEPQG